MRAPLTMMLIYTPSLNQRLRYAFASVMRDYEGEWHTTTEEEYWLQHQGPKLRYATDRTSADTFFIKRNELLWNHTDLSTCPEIPVALWQDTISLFSSDCSLGFDIFSACFFMLTRMEEYAAGACTDKYGRFSAKDALSGKYGQNRKPIVDIWITHFQREVCKHWPQVRFRQSSFQLISTIDVDSAFAYRHKGLKRTLGGIAKDIIQLKPLNLYRRLLTLARIRPDEYDTYQHIHEQHKKYGIQGIFFFLLADFGPMDKNVPHTSTALQKVIKEANSQALVGVHPGVASNKAISILRSEIKRLQAITCKPCTRSRQHYLILKWPDTYRHLLDTGITDDYSMGFADDVGFRAGTCRPFKWYDLPNDEPTELTVHPFAAMDTTMQRYLMLQPAAARALHLQLMNEVKKVEGNYILLWHNESLSDKGRWKHWRSLWVQMLQDGSALMRKT